MLLVEHHVIVGNQYFTGSMLVPSLGEGKWTGVCVCVCVCARARVHILR